MPNAAELQRQCDKWNERWPIGQAVTVRKDDGSGVSTTTRSKAQVLSGYIAVIWLDGISGCYMLDRVTPVVSKAAA